MYVFFFSQEKSQSIIYIYGRKRAFFDKKWFVFAKKGLFSAIHDALTFYSKQLRKEKTRTCSSVTRLSIVPLYFENEVKVKTGGVSGDFCFWVLAKTHTGKISLRIELVWYHSNTGIVSYLVPVPGTWYHTQSRKMSVH